MLRDTADGSGAGFVQNRLVATTRDPDPVPVTIPEPTSVALFGLGMPGVAGARTLAASRAAVRPGRQLRATRGAGWGCRGSRCG
ncbi:MAG: PEP-CTERM sorting domain-containing protein [Acidobacteria bacterium]|nr:PEP-CTERM sorting domain-containing protein [Acidobacteriota bacterium]